jgi:upstream activation factor subunit UAF30
MSAQKAKTNKTAETAPVAAPAKKTNKAKAETAPKATKGNTKRISYFSMPVIISDELAQFLGKESGIEMARNDLTKEIWSYIKKKNLQDPTDKRIIHCDVKLGELFGLKKENYTFKMTQLQTHLQRTLKKINVSTA